MALDVTDQTFETDVLARSDDVPVVVDLWAPWCGPCRTLGPIIERVVEDAAGKVELVKVNVDDNPQVSSAFQVQSIPAVFAVSKRKIVDGFVGALPEAAVKEFVDRLLEAPSEADVLTAAGDEESLRKALELQPDHPVAVAALAELLVGDGATDEALALLARVPETADTRRIAALARLAAADDSAAALRNGSVEARLDELLERAKDDNSARQEFVDLLEAMDVDDPRRASYRRALASRLF
ncbi:MAG: putative thioredoxin [Acidimicrobiaceae bacterium]|jgi:putative thioredoxin|nr:putative thioredoxin [Acidimicrobiaceae bacterium]